MRASTLVERIPSSASKPLRASSQGAVQLLGQDVREGQARHVSSQPGLVNEQSQILGKVSNVERAPVISVSESSQHLLLSTWLNDTLEGRDWRRKKPAQRCVPKVDAFRAPLGMRQHTDVPSASQSSLTSCVLFQAGRRLLAGTGRVPSLGQPGCLLAWLPCPPHHLQLSYL